VKTDICLRNAMQKEQDHIYATHEFLNFIVHNGLVEFTAHESRQRVVVDRHSSGV
jgi:hypothetical protein